MRRWEGLQDDADGTVAHERGEDPYDRPTTPWASRVGGVTCLAQYVASKMRAGYTMISAKDGVVIWGAPVGVVQENHGQATPLIGAIYLHFMEDE